MPPVPRRPAGRRSWSPGAVAAALALAAAAAFVFCPPFPRGDSGYSFEATFSSNQRGIVQLYFDVGRGFNEPDSRFRGVEGDGVPRLIRLPLPLGRYTALRFDPLDHSGVITVAHAVVRDGRGRVVRAFGPGSFEPLHQIRRLSVEGSVLRIETEVPADDPNLWIHLDAPFELVRPVGRDWARYAAVAAGWWAAVLLMASLAGRFAGPWAAAACRQPASALALVSLAAVLLNSHPVVFFGRSFVSPNNGVLLLYDTIPTLPGYDSTAVEDVKGSDVGAVMWWHLPVAAVERQAILRDHELPLWDRYDLGGQPLLGQGQSMLGDPLHWATALLGGGSALAWDVKYLAAKWLFAFGTGLVVLELTGGLGVAALLAASSLYIGFFGFRLNHPAFFSVCYSPWILYAWMRLARSPAARPWGWAAALGAFDLVEINSGTVKEAYILAFGLNLTGGLLVLLGAEPRPRRLGRLAAAAWATFLIGLVAAPFWLTFLDTLRVSLTSYEHPAAQQLPLPRLIGFFEDLFYRQGDPSELQVAPSANVLVLVGLLWAAVEWRALAASRAAGALAAAAAVAAAIIFGVVPGAWIIALPLLRNIAHVANTFSCLLLVLVLPLAGWGVHRALARARGDGWARSASAAAALGAAVLALYFLVGRPAGFSPFFVGDAAVLLAAAVLLHAAVRRLVASNRASLAPPLLVALALAALLWRHGQYLRTGFDAYVFNPQERVDLAASSPALAYAEGRKEVPSRTLGLGLNFFPGFNQEHLIEGIYGIEALRSREYVYLAQALGLKRVVVFTDRDSNDTSGPHRAAYDALNVEYFVSSAEFPAAAVPSWQHPRELDFALYRSPTFWPRAFFARQLARYGDLPQLVGLLRRSAGPLAAVQDGEAEGQPEIESLVGAPAAGPAIPATGYALTSNRTAFDIQATGPGVAVLLESWFPGDFEATVNGRPVPYFRVNHAFKGVYLPAAGTYRVAFTYWPRHLTLALGLAAAGLALGAATAVGAMARSRRPGPAALDR